MTGTSKTRHSAVAVAAVLILVLLAVGAGCAKYNTFFNAKRLFDDAERVRENAIREHKDPPVPAGGQKSNYENAIKKAQKLIDDYPGHNLTDDALFLQGKSYYRLESHRMSIRKFDLLFTNFPATPFMEEALFLQSLNYLMLGTLVLSQDYLDKLAMQFPESEFQSQTLKVSGDNAFAMEDWEEASGHFREFLSQFPDSKEWDRVGIKMGECLWELKDYEGVARILQEVTEKTSSTEIGFQAGLLRALALIRTGEFDLAEELLGELEETAEIYSSQGEVLLAQVELYIALGKSDEAFPLLETMPDAWRTPQVKARLGDMLGNLRLDRHELEEAQTSFKDALMGRTFLEDEFRTKRLHGFLKDYLAAEDALSDAKPARVSRLKLLQANAMLFGFDRPSEAARLYREAAVDTAADSTVAARALYGATMIFREYLIKPDSAAFYESLLEERYPDSPQAFEMRTIGEGNLLAFLLDRRTEEQRDRLADLSQEELAELSTVKEFVASIEEQEDAEVLHIRRRQVYLSRRSNILFPPPEIALAAARLVQERKLAASASEGGLPTPGAGESSGQEDGPEPGTPVGPESSTATDPTATDPTVTDPVTAQEETEELKNTAAEKKQEQEDKEEEIEQDKEKKRTWEFDLRSPAPGPDARPAPVPGS